MAFVREASAGGIVIRRNDAQHIEVLLIQQGGHAGWGFPKGWIEEGETPAEAALREVEEESGVLAEILSELPATRYFYMNQQRQRVSKTVQWYLMRYLGEGNQTHAHEVMAVEWLPLETVHSRITYNNDKELFSVALGEIVNGVV